MKYIFTLLTLIISLPALAQLPVSTAPQKKKAVIEEFNGIHCQFCPDGHRITENIYNSDPENVIIVNVHAGSLSVPGPGEPDFRTVWGNSLANLSGLTGYPSAMINRQRYFGEDEMGMGRGMWANAAAVLLQQDAAANVALEADIDVQNRQMTVDVEIYYTANANESTNFLNIVLTQGNVRGVQDGLGENIDKVDDEGYYIHDHALRDMFTGQWGDTIYTTSAGTLVQKQYTFDIPAIYSNVDVDLGELEVVAFLTETKEDVINGAKYTPTVSNFTKNLDAQIDRVRVPAVACDVKVAPVVYLRNNGNSTLTQVEIDYNANGGASAFYTWKGNLLPGHSEEVSLEGIDYTPVGSNMAAASIKTVNGESGEEPCGTTSMSSVESHLFEQEQKYMEI